MNLIGKDRRCPDAPPSLGKDSKYHPGCKHYVNDPRMHEYLREIHDKMLQKYNAIRVDEMPGVSNVSEIIQFVSSNSKKLNMDFIFDIIYIDDIPDRILMLLQP